MYLLQEQLHKFHPDPIWNDGALDFFEDVRPNKTKSDKNSQMLLLSVSLYYTTRYNVQANTESVQCLSKK